MANLLEWIIDAVNHNEDEIEGVVMGDFMRPEKGNKTDYPRNTPLSWEKAKKYLNFDFDDGFGICKCMAIYVWTKKYVYGIHEYDGSTQLSCMPRNPQDCKPEYI